MHIKYIAPHGPKSRHFLGLIAVIVIPVAVLWSWNAVMPDVFALPKITYVQAVALTFLTVIAGGLTFRRRAPHRLTSESEN